MHLIVKEIRLTLKPNEMKHKKPTLQPRILTFLQQNRRGTRLVWQFYGIFVLIILVLVIPVMAHSGNHRTTPHTHLNLLTKSSCLHSIGPVIRRWHCHSCPHMHTHAHKQPWRRSVCIGVRHHANFHCCDKNKQVWGAESEGPRVTARSTDKQGELGWREVVEGGAGTQTELPWSTTTAPHHCHQPVWKPDGAKSERAACDGCVLTVRCVQGHIETRGKVC